MENHSFGSDLKQRNRNSIYRLLLNNDAMTKQHIMTELGLSLPTITQNLNELCEKGLICENGIFCNTGGRRAKGYTAVSDARVAVGVDLNKRHYSMVILDLHGTILARFRKTRKFSKTQKYYMEIGAAVDKLIADAEIASEQILGVGIAVQGIIDAEAKAVSYGSVLGITGLTLEELGQYINYPKALFHDSDMAAQAEFWSGHDDKHSVYISLSTNLGGAIIGAPSFDTAGSFGLCRLEHMTLMQGGRKCYCGQYGCADAYCSTTLLTDATPDGKLETFFKLLDNNNSEVKKVWDEYIHYLAIVINNARMMFDSPVILGGYLAEYLEKYLDTLKELAYQRNSFEKGSDYLRLSNVTVESVAVGAALQYIEEFIESV